MRLFYTACFLLITAPLLFSQKIRIEPVQGNNQLRSYAAKKQLELEELIEKTTGVNPRLLDSDRFDMCPNDFPLGKHIVESGKLIEVEIDTFGLAVDSTPPVITLLTDPPLLFGNAFFDAQVITVIYIADSGLDGMSSDTVLIQYEQGGGAVDTILKVAIDIKRKGKNIVADGVTVNPEEQISYCLDDEVDFPNPRCSYEFVDCIDGYDGEGHQIQYFFIDTCIIYKASRFPGVDTVCIEICDDLLICDTFKIPIIIRGDTLSLSNKGVFFEDFSNSNSPYPSPERWLDDDVYINNTFAANPPSVGMATFDGLDRAGRPYNLINGGVGDKLTSNPIDLSALTIDSNVYLRYFVALKGYGPAPEEEDPFIVEFRNDQRQWIGMDTIVGANLINFDSVPPFIFYAIKVGDPSFFHDAFQFRFKANSSPGGTGDWWHLDYIHLQSGSTDVNNYSDFAFASIPQTFLKNYTSMPLRHLQADLEGEIKTTPGDPYSIILSNRSVLNEANFSDSFVQFEETTTSVNLGNPVFPVGSDDDSLTDQLMHKEMMVKIPISSRVDLIDELASFPENDTINILTEFSMNSNIAETDIFQVNDTVRINTLFSSHFAHDDGSAEMQFALGSPDGGEDVAVQYKANVADSLKGIQIMFPHFTFYDVEGQFFNLKVWLGDENGPFEDSSAVFEVELLRPFFVTENYDSLEAFTTYRLEDDYDVETPLGIDAGQFFYVGFEQLTDDDLGIPIGYDVNNPCECNFVRQENKWEIIGPNDYPQGALMIRPVFESVINSSNPTNESNIAGYNFSVYPNPATNVLKINLPSQEYTDFQYIIVNQVGQMVQMGDMGPAIAVHQLNSGIYYLQTMKKATGEVWIEKFIIAKK